MWFTDTTLQRTLISHSNWITHISSTFWPLWRSQTQTDTAVHLESCFVQSAPPPSQLDKCQVRPHQELMLSSPCKWSYLSTESNHLRVSDQWRHLQANMMMMGKWICTRKVDSSERENKGGLFAQHYRYCTWNKSDQLAFFEKQSKL